MATASLSDLVVEILHNRGDDAHPDWSVGSGYFVGAHLVLTAAHNVDGAGVVLVRVHGTEEYPAEVRLQGNPDLVDLALLEVPTKSVTVPPLRYATVDRTTATLVKQCRAVGFPQFKERAQKPKPDRPSAHLTGEIPTGDNLDRPQLTLLVKRRPRPPSSSAQAQSAWEGMSGAVVFAGEGDNVIVGVIFEHYLPEGENALTVVPITALDQLPDTEAAKWWQLLGVERGTLVPLPGEAGGPPGAAINLTVAEERYRQQVVDAYKWLDFGGFAYPDLHLTHVPLEDLFVRLTRTVKKDIRDPVSLAKASRTEGGEILQRERVITVQEPIELGKALGTHLLIVGEPGAGKSTLLRWLAVTFAQRAQRNPNRVGPSADADRLPVLVQLGRLAKRYLQPEGGETPNWLQYLPEYLHTQLAFTNTPPQLLTKALDDGRCLLLFDGLDEVADRQARDRLARSLVELARSKPGNRVLIGSRPAGVSESAGALGPQFQRCQIKPFAPEDVQRFFRFLYSQDHRPTSEPQRDAADALYASVQATPATLQLATTPLLSTILVQIWRNEKDLPQRRVDLYARCCRYLIEQWEPIHDVDYQGVLAKMPWEDYLHLLTPLAYTIHSQEQRTSATREELVPLFAQTLQTAGYATEQAATREAKQYLDILGLRSGLLQYMGDDRYGFAHQTFQEYLAARYIAAQPDPEYISLVMPHLYEAWWHEVHLLTIAHLGSGSAGAIRASDLILKILQVYTLPSWILRSSRNRWLRLIGPGKLLPQVQLERRIAWVLAREFELAIQGYAECVPEGTTAEVTAALSAQAVSFVRRIVYDYDEDRFEEQEALLKVICLLLQRQGNEVVVRALLKALHEMDKDVRMRAAWCLGQVGANNETVVWTLLLVAVYDPRPDVQRSAAVSLGRVGANNETVVRMLLEALHDADKGVRMRAALSLGQVGANNEAVVRMLLEALHGTDLDVQRSAAVSLGEVGTDNKEVVDALLKTLHDTDKDVRASAALSLGQVGAGNKEVTSVLLEALHDADKDVRASAALSLGQVGAGNKEVTSVLLEALHDADEHVRLNAAFSLERVGAGNKEVASVLLEALHAADKDVRAYAAEILRQVGAGNEAVGDALLEALYDADKDVRARAAEILPQVGAGNKKVVSVLLEGLQAKDWAVRMSAALNLGVVGAGNEAVSALLEALHDPNEIVRMFTAVSLGVVGADNEAVELALLKTLHGANPVVRLVWFILPEPVVRLIAFILAHLGIGVGALLQERNPLVRKFAAVSLGRLKIKDTIQQRQVLVVLNRHLHDWDRGLALTSIRRLLDDQPILGYQWSPLQQRSDHSRRRRQLIGRIAFVTTLAVFLVLIGLSAAGVLDSNSLLFHLLVGINVSLAAGAALATILGRTWRDPWDHNVGGKQPK